MQQLLVSSRHCKLIKDYINKTIIGSFFYSPTLLIKLEHHPLGVVQEQRHTV